MALVHALYYLKPQVQGMKCNSFKFIIELLLILITYNVYLFDSTNVFGKSIEPKASFVLHAAA